MTTPPFTASRDIKKTPELSAFVDGLEESQLLVEPERTHAFTYSHEKTCTCYSFFCALVVCIVLSPLILLFLLNSLCWRRIGTKFASKTTQFNVQLIDNILSKVGHYVPPWWYNLHLGAILPFGASPCLLFDREVYTHPDGTTFAVDWYPVAPCNRPQSAGFLMKKLFLLKDFVSRVYLLRNTRLYCFFSGFVPSRTRVKLRCQCCSDLGSRSYQT